MADVPTPATPVVALSGLGRRFGTDPPVDALVDVDLQVPDGQWVAVIGPSGSGKSTLLNVIGCLDIHTEGTYMFCGLDVGALTDRQRAGLRCRAMGFVFQAFHLLGQRSVLENVMLAEVYRRAPFSHRRERAAEALDKVGMGHRADFMPTRLSGGERQRTAIARALMGSPRLLLCDEPTGNLDSNTTASVLDLFQQLNESGMTIITITHEPDVAERASRQVRIIDGILAEVA